MAASDSTANGTGQVILDPISRSGEYHAGVALQRRLAAARRRVGFEVLVPCRIQVDRHSCDLHRYSPKPGEYLGVYWGPNGIAEFSVHKALKSLARPGGEQGYSQRAALALANARDLPAEGWTLSRSEKANPRPPGSKSHGLIKIFS